MYPKIRYTDTIDVLVFCAYFNTAFSTAMDNTISEAL